MKKLIWAKIFITLLIVVCTNPPINAQEIGSLNPWSYTSEINQGGGTRAAIAYNGYIYAVAGNNDVSDLNSVEFAKILYNGEKRCHILNCE